MVEIDSGILRHAPVWPLEVFAKHNKAGFLSSYDPIMIVSGEDSPSDMYYWLEEVDEGCVFTFNGAKFLALIDPQDGYRSCVDSLFELPADFETKNKFRDVQVNVSHLDDIKGTFSDHLCSMLIFSVGNVPALEIGTMDVNDYYPSGIIRFTPLFQSSMHKMLQYK